MRSVLLPTALAVLSFVSSTSAANVPPPRLPAGESISVGYVLVPFTALNRRGRPLANLEGRDVTLLVDGRRVVTDLFQKSENAPVSFTILVDVSGSMGLAGKLGAARASIDVLLARGIRGDEFALYSFADGEVVPVIELTTDTRRVREAMARLTPFGKTAFYDALALIPEKSREGSNGAKAIILLTDGIDNSSLMSREAIISLIEGIEVPIFPVALREPSKASAGSEKGADLLLLGEIAERSGGELIIGTDPDRLRSAIASLDRNLRSQYLIGFSPAARGAVKYRRIQLKVSGRVRVTGVREGYLGTEPRFQERDMKSPDKSRKARRRNR